MTLAGHQLWTTLSASPLLWLTVTLMAFAIGTKIQMLAKGAAWASPVLIGILIVAAIVSLTRTSYHTYFMGAQYIHFLLGPVTVALGLPLARNSSHVRR